MADAIIFPYRILWEANRRKEYRDRISTKAAALVSFLQDNGLVKKRIVPPNSTIPLDLCLRESDLTEEGRAVIHQALDSWLDGHDRGNDPADVAILVRALAKAKKLENVPQSEMPPVTREVVSEIDSTESERVKFDDASWHLEGSFPDDVPPQNSYVFGGMLLTFLALRGLMAGPISKEFKKELAELSRRKVTPGRFYDVLGGSIGSDMVTERGHRFLKKYVGLGSSSKYAGDFHAAIAVDLPTIYHVKDSWENYDKLEPFFLKELDNICDP